eukprot:m.57767 g.57767  ORF g.57767 m.57767 type:complete len:724 (+) comp13746_c0_seq1:77-2248(+)
MTDVASTGPVPTDSTSMPAASTTLGSPSDPSATTISQALPSSSTTAIDSTKTEPMQTETDLPSPSTKPNATTQAALPETSDAAPSTEAAATPSSVPGTAAATATVELNQPSASTTPAEATPAPTTATNPSLTDATSTPAEQEAPASTAPTQSQSVVAPTTTVANPEPATVTAPTSTANGESSYSSSTPTATPSAAAQPTPAAESTSQLLASNSYKPSTADVGDDAISEVASTQPGSPTGKRSGRLTNQLQHLSKVVVPHLFKHDFSWPFRKPVDWKKLNLPTYPDIIKHPMDLGTIKKKLQKKEYYSAKECIADIALIWRNCQTFNREQDDVFKMSHTLQEEFERLLKSLPEEEVEIVRPTAASRKVSTATTPAAFAPPSRRQSSRTIKAPARSLSSDSLRGNRELRACADIIKELFHKRHVDYAWPFLEPVDVVKLNLTDYYDVIKEPMDLGSVKKNLEAGMYDTADAFARDVRLVFSNCYNYNPPGSDVVKMANSTSQVFEMQFAALKSGTSLASVKTTSRRRVDSSSSGSSSDSSDDDATAMQVQHLQTAIMGAYQQLQAISGGQMPLNMGMLPVMPKKKKKKKSKKHKKHKAKRQHETVYDYEEEEEEYRAKRPKQRTSRPAPTNYNAGQPAAVMNDESDGESDNEVLPMTWDEKRLLSQNIKLLPAHMLHHIVDIVKSCEPSMRNTSSDEIEIDFDELRPKTLRELDRFVKESLPNEG